MSPPRRAFAGGIALVLALVLSAGCENAPTRYPRDPVVGKWIGEFSRLNGTQSNAGEFEIVVQAGGDAAATGISDYWHSVGYLREMVYIRLLVGTGGTAAGQGAILAFSDKGYLWMEGVAFAEFDGATGQGTGSLEIDTGEGAYVLSWTVRKEGSK